MNIEPIKTVDPRTLVMAGPSIAAYGFPNGHPFGPDRHAAFLAELERSDCFGDLQIVEPLPADKATICQFHTERHVDFVEAASRAGEGLLDTGDTPSYPGVFDAVSAVVGGTIYALERVLTGDAGAAFIPIGGLHHARRDGAAGFCVFNDCGVAIEHARNHFGLERVAYIDIDAHHGDGVFYGFEDDPGVIIADTHEDGRFLYPGTGRREESGKGAAAGTKLNVPLAPGTGDSEFLKVWEEIEAFLVSHDPELYLLQCGADSVAGDPLAHLEFSVECHAHAALRLKSLAERTASGRLLAMGGGGYDRNNLARCWTRVVEAINN